MVVRLQSVGPLVVFTLASGLALFSLRLASGLASCCLHLKLLDWLLVVFTLSFWTGLLLSSPWASGLASCRLHLELMDWPLVVLTLSFWTGLVFFLPLASGLASCCLHLELQDWPHAVFTLSVQRLHSGDPRGDAWWRKLERLTQNAQ
jgi:type IV secretory pathway TrbD component